VIFIIQKIEIIFITKHYILVENEPTKLILIFTF